MLRAPAATARLREARQDDGFRGELARLARSSVRVGGALGAGAVLLFVALHVAVLGKPMRWTFEPGAVALWDKALLVGLCLAAAVAGPRLRLGGARALVVGLALVGAFVSSVGDVAAGDTSFSSGFATFMFLLAVAAVPFRPGQALALGAGLTAATALAFSLAPALGAEAVANATSHYVYFAIVTVLLTGISGLLYAVRYGQYQARREAERLTGRVQKAETAKMQFFTNVSHEVRTPLTLILGPLQDALAGRYGDLPPRLDARLTEMDAQARHLRDLVDQLLDISKLEAGAMPLYVREHDLGVLFQRHAALFRSALERQGGALHVDVPDAPLVAWVDAERIERVLSNLLSNAVKHSPPGGAVRVRLSAEGSEAVLSVRDAGAGIPRDALETVFDRFASASGTAGGQASTGIGLALVKEITERHGGSVQVDSEPAFGAEFTVRLPLGTDHLAPEDLASGPAAPTPEPAGPPLPETAVGPTGATRPEPPAGAPTVVVAEDDAAIRAYLADLLGTAYRVVPAADGNAAWTCIRELRPALVVSDVMMHGADGLDLCARIRADDALASTPVLLLTALADERDRVDGWRSGADAYLTKPFSGEEVLAVAEHLIEVRERLRDRVRVPDWLAPEAVDVSAPDAAFLERAQSVVAEHIGDPGFGVDWMAGEVGLSARQLQRRLKALTGLTAAAFIRAMRLEQSARLLHDGDPQVQEVARAVGYEDADHFSRLFRQVHGVPPSAFADRPVADRPVADRT